MAAKSEKIADVKKPEKVTPTASGRPILVTNRPVLTSDPMMAPEETASNSDKPAEPVSRTAKTIAPVTIAEQAEETPARSDPPTEALGSIAPASESAEVKNSAGESETAAPPETPEAAVTETRAEPSERDVAAATTANETAELEAQTARQAELDTLIASGKYLVPINAVQRKRSHMYTALLCIFALLLAALLLDAVLDANLVKLPFSVPHTNFL